MSQMPSETVTRCELDPSLKQKWEDTLSLFMWSAPGFRHLLYKLLNNNDGGNVAVFTKDVPVAATDNLNVMINPDTFFNLNLKERVFVLAHEVIHCVYNDPETLNRAMRAEELRYHDGTKLPFDNDTFQIAMDLRINDALINSKIGDMPTGKFKGVHDTSIAKANDGVYDIYRKIYDPQKGGGKGKGQGQGQGQSGFDVVLPPGSSTGQSPQQVPPRNAQQWATEMAVAQSLESMKARGNVSADLQRMFDMYLKPQVPWTDHIQGFFARKLGSGSYSWRKPDRRLIVRDIYTPGRSGFGVNWIAVWGDTSGSISLKELNAYFAELGGLIEDLRPRRVTVFWCDSEIKQVDDLEDFTDLEGVRARGVKGGGGTDCRPVFKAIDKMSYDAPDAFVGLTDGMATFPKDEPRYPCVWACTANHAIPFGEVVRIKGEAQSD